MFQVAKFPNVHCILLNEEQEQQATEMASQVGLDVTPFLQLHIETWMKQIAEREAELNRKV